MTFDPNVGHHRNGYLNAEMEDEINIDWVNVHLTLFCTNRINGELGGEELFNAAYTINEITTHHK